MGLVVRNFTFTGATQTFTVPPLVDFLTFKLWGAGGGNTGGPGGYTTGSLVVTQGTTFNIVVGGGGVRLLGTSSFGGGGGTGANTFDGFLGSQGGGMSSITRQPSTLLLIAGGGGGGSSAGSGFSTGGPGGGTNGLAAFGISTPTANQGKGGTQAAGGAGGTNAAGAFSNGVTGTQFQGGRGGPSGNINCGSGGGGGGGFFGGGGGAGQFDVVSSAQDCAGGGGSSFIGPVLNGSTQSSPQITVSSPPASALNPPNTTDPQYIAPLGAAGADLANGQNGLVVITYTLPDITPTKFVDKPFATIGETVNYTIVVFNPGPVTVPNVIFVDTVPSNATFIPNSLTLNGGGIVGNANPPGITIPSIGVGLSATVTFQVLITTLPSPNRIQNVATTSYSTGPVINSNTVTTTINYVALTSTKTVSKSYANVGNVLTYTIPITNTGNSTALSINFSDTIPNGTSLESGSFTQNGVALAGSPNPPGVTLSNIAPGKTSTIVFKVKINTIPNPNPIPNAASIVFTYTIDPSSSPNRTNSSGTNTNQVTTQVNNANLDSAQKYVSKDYAACGDELTYTIVVPNKGNVTAQNILFKDTIPNGTTFVTDSVFINGNRELGANPTAGFTVPNISPGVTTTITFSVKIQC